MRPYFRQHAWDAIRKLKQFTTGILANEIQRATQSSVNEWTVRTYLQALEKAGIVRLVRDQKNGVQTYYLSTSFKAGLWELVKDVGVDAPRVSRKGELIQVAQKREQVWRTIKIIGEFDYRDLAIQATTEESVIKESYARDYVKELYKAGYLVLLRKSKPNRPARYRLLPSAWTGPHAPQVVKVEGVKKLYDPNLKKVNTFPGAFMIPRGQCAKAAM